MPLSQKIFEKILCHFEGLLRRLDRMLAARPMAFDRTKRRHLERRTEMRARRIFHCFTIIPLLAGWSAGSSLAVAASRDPGTAQITVLYDSFGRSSDMHKDWGYSALIEYGGQRILFDTGDNPKILAHNAKAKGVDLTDLDFVVMSHRHGDHISGLAYLLRVNPNVEIYAPKENFGVFGWDLPGSFYRKDPSLPIEQRYFDGEPPETLHFGSAWPRANFHLIDQTVQIAPRIYLIATVSQKTGTLELHEVSLALDTPDGLVLLFVNTMTYLLSQLGDVI